MSSTLWYNWHLAKINTGGSHAFGLCNLEEERKVPASSKGKRSNAWIDNLYLEANPSISVDLIGQLVALWTTVRDIQLN